MPELSVLLDPLDAIVTGPQRDDFHIGLALPASGPMGMARPAGVAAAVLAAEQVNDRGGMRGRRVRLVPIDAGESPSACATSTDGLVTAGALDAVLGFHTSDVHRALGRVTSHRVPYVFTAPHEGGNRLPGVAVSGPDPLAQLANPLAQLRAAGARRWALVGSDYIWPRAVHRAATAVLNHLDADVSAQLFVPLGLRGAETLVTWLARQRVDAVLLSLVGRDLAVFNRAFAASPRCAGIVRLSGALEESGLLEIGGDRSGDLYAAMDWYAQSGASALESSFLSRWGPLGPPLSAYAQGLYEGALRVVDHAATGALSAHVPNAGLLRDVETHRAGARLACAEGLRLVPTR